MSDIQISLSPSEREMLVRLLTNARKEKRIEVHRTEFSRSYRQELEAEEAQLEHILGKLSAAVEV